MDRRTRTARTLREVAGNVVRPIVKIFGNSKIPN